MRKAQEAEGQGADKAARPWYARKYNQDNINAQLPKVLPPQKGFAGELGQDLLNITNSVRNSGRMHQSLNAFKDRNQLPTDDRYNELLMAGRFEQSHGNSVKAGELYTAVYKEYSATLTDQAWSHMTVWHQVASGFDFSFDFGAAKEVKQAAERPQVVRYGLVLKDIQPDAERKTMTASLNDTTIDEWEAASPAKPVWTIAPVEDHGEIELRKVAVPVYVDEASEIATTSDAIYPNTYIEQVEIHDRRAGNTLVFWKVIEKLPDPKLKGKIKPRAMPGTQALPSKMPGMEISISQAQGFYTATMLTKSNGANEQVIQTFSTPIIGHMGTARTYDEKFKLKRYTVSNILVYGHLPGVHVTRYVVDDFADQNNKIYAGTYKTSVQFGRNQHSVTFSATTPPDYDLGTDFWQKPGERYDIQYNYNF